MEPLTLQNSDKEIEDRIRLVGSPHFHVAGTRALGTVLDVELRVKGVQGLRVVNASISPAPLGGHPQASLYGIADLAAEMIAGSGDGNRTSRPVSDVQVTSFSMFLLVVVKRQRIMD
jgi:choline dehydrogenase-like flavoprotein